MTKTALIIGGGYAGTRFARVLEQRGFEWGISLAAIVDPDRSKARAGATHYVDLRTGLLEHSPAVVINATNEKVHHEVSRVLNEHLAYGSLVLSEKPLASNTLFADQVVEHHRGHTFYMNMVERYSPVVDAYRRWIEEQDAPARLLRAEAFWGKYRFFDSRPTIGVLSEVIHPLDLIDFQFGPIEMDSAASLSVSSDFSSIGTTRPESLDVHFTSRGAPVLLHSSYAWPTRTRTIHVIVEVDDRLYSVHQRFDTPHWDDDSITIREISTHGRWIDVFEKSFPSQHLSEPNLGGLSKVSHFMEDAVHSWRKGEPSTHSTTLLQARRLQGWLQKIEQSCRSVELSFQGKGRA